MESAKQGQRFRYLWVTLGLSLISLGIYLIVFHQNVFFHVDRIFAGGKTTDALTDVRLHDPEAGPERVQKVLVEDAYFGYLPDLFLALGACALGWGGFLLAYLRMKARWLEVINRSKDNTHNR